MLHCQQLRIFGSFKFFEQYLVQTMLNLDRFIQITWRIIEKSPWNWQCRMRLWDRTSKDDGQYVLKKYSSSILLLASLGMLSTVSCYFFSLFYPIVFFWGSRTWRIDTVHQYRPRWNESGCCHQQGDHFVCVVKTNLCANLIAMKKDLQIQPIILQIVLDNRLFFFSEKTRN